MVTMDSMATSTSAMIHTTATTDRFPRVAKRLSAGFMPALPMMSMVTRVTPGTMGVENIHPAFLAAEPRDISEVGMKAAGIAKL
jgi:hypothetical protein